MTDKISPEAVIGSVELYVADLTRAASFYEKTLGFTILEQTGGRVVLGSGSHRLIVLNERPGAKAVQRTTGLYHFAVLLPERKSLARLLYHLAETGANVQGAADHGVSEALYLSDPDGNGIELYCDRRQNAWPVDDLGRLQMGTEELDIDDLVLELKSGVEIWKGLPETTTIGHIHLRVRNLVEAETFYTKILGFTLMQRYTSGAIFVSAGGYHHHIGLNTWGVEGAPPPPPTAPGLRWFEVPLPDQAAQEAVLARLQSAGVSYAAQEAGALVQDPSQNSLLFRVSQPGSQG